MFLEVLKNIILWTLLSQLAISAIITLYLLLLVFIHNQQVILMLEFLSEVNILWMILLSWGPLEIAINTILIRLDMLLYCIIPLIWHKRLYHISVMESIIKVIWSLHQAVLIFLVPLSLLMDMMELASLVLCKCIINVIQLPAMTEPWSLMLN